jgi:hypothetical protein
VIVVQFALSFPLTTVKRYGTVETFKRPRSSHRYPTRNARSLVPAMFAWAAAVAFSPETTAAVSPGRRSAPSAKQREQTMKNHEQTMKNHRARETDTMTRTPLEVRVEALESEFAAEKAERATADARISTVLRE